MKTNTPNSRWACFLLMVAAALFGTVINTQAQVAAPTPTGNWTNSFNQIVDASNRDNNATNWIYWFGGTVPAGQTNTSPPITTQINNVFNNNQIEWDPTVDATGNGLGSLKVVIPYSADKVNNAPSNTVPNTNGTVIMFGTFDNAQFGATLQTNGRYYTNVTFKVKFAPDSKTNGAGNLGQITLAPIISGTPNSGAPNGNNIQIPPSATNGFITITSPVTIAQRDTVGYESPGIIGVVFRFTSANNNGTNQFPYAPVRFWVDDVVLEVGNFTPPPLPGPVLSFAESKTTGLVITPLSGANNVRTLIQTANPVVNTNLWWVDAVGPVTYQMSIADMPNNNGSFQAHIFLSAGANAGGTPDFNDPNVMFLDIRRNTDGTALANWRPKTNGAGNNNMTYFQGPYPATGASNQTRRINTPTAFGTWGMTFLNNTNVTIFGPGGVSSNFDTPPEFAAMFRPSNTPPSMIAYFGDQNNNNADIGLSIVLTNVQIISNGVTIINDSFPAIYGAAEVDTTKWTRRGSQNGAGIFVQTNTGWQLSWNSPDGASTPQYASNFLGPWTDTDTILFPASAGAQRRVLIPYASLPSKSNLFFRLTRRLNGLKLLVLAPGESYNPVAGGKTGSVISQTFNNPFQVRVVLVDVNNRRSGGSGDTIALPLASNSAFLTQADGVTPLPITTAMLDSQVAFTVTYTDIGSVTVTAHDNSDPANKADGTSVAIPVN